jgi:hypothetical protein
MSPQNDYDAGPFTNVALKWGDPIWAILNGQSAVRQMKEASDAGRPAAEAIAAELYREYGPEIKADRVKQFTGYLIRQVMERNGYIHEAYGMQTHENPVFVKASRYSRRDSQMPAKPS